MAQTLTTDGAGNWTWDDGAGNTLTGHLAPDPNGAPRLQLITQGFTGTPSPLAEIEMAGNRASLRLINCGGSADVLTSPATISNPDAGLPAWGG